MIKVKAYKNLRRLFRPIYTNIENSRINNKRNAHQIDNSYDRIIPDQRHLEEDTIEKIKLIGVRILSILNDITQKNEIHFFLFWGSLLGAIRHNGYIPWDDDLDVAMTRQEFKKLEEKLHLFPESIEIICHDIGFYKIMDKHSIFSQDGKRGIAVDIFIIEKFRNEFYFHNVHSRYFNKINKDQIYPLRQHPFEKHSFPIPNKPKEILTMKYGDFMKLPPIEKRVYPHFGENILINDYAKIN